MRLKIATAVAGMVLASLALPASASAETTIDPETCTVTGTEDADTIQVPPSHYDPEKLCTDWQVYPLGGNDTVNLIARETVHGSEGNDTYVISTKYVADQYADGANGDTIDDFGTDTVDYSSMPNGIFLFKNEQWLDAENLIATSFDDGIDERDIGRDVSSTIWLGAGADYYDGENYDTLSDTVHAGRGADTIHTKSAAGDIVYMGRGTDTAYTYAGNDYIRTGPGADTLFAGRGNDSAAYDECDTVKSVENKIWP